MAQRRTIFDRSDRRTVLKAAGGLGTAGLAGCLGGGASSDNAISFVLTPAESEVDVEKQYKPLLEYLESETGATIEPTVAADYNAVIAALRDDQAEMADASPSAAVAAKDVADVVGIRVAFGAELYFSLLTTTVDSDVESLSDISGGTVALADQLSTSGSLVPLLMLKQAGLDIGDAPRGNASEFETAHSNHSTARKQLIERDEIVAAGTGAFSTAPHVPKEQFKEQSSDFVDISADYEGAGSETPELQLLSVSDPLPRAPILSRNSWDADIRSDVETALLEASEEDITDPDREGDQALWFSGVKEGSIDDYDPIAAVLDELGLEFGEIA